MQDLKASKVSEDLKASKVLTLILCAQKLALGNSVVATGEGEERSRVASVLWCRMDEGNGTSYIVTQVLRIVEPGHHQSHLGDAIMAINYRFNCTFNRTINCCQRQNSHRTAPHRTCTSRPAAHAHAHRPSGRPAAPRRASPRPRPRPRPGPARPGSARRASARARVVHRPPLTGFTSGVQEVHLLSRLRSSSIPGTELNIDSLALIVGFKFF